MISALTAVIEFLYTVFYNLWTFLFTNEVGWHIIGFFVIGGVFSIITRVIRSRNSD